MSQSLAKIYIHVVFSTKDRFPFIITEWKEKLFAYLAGIIRNQMQSAFCIVGGTADHAHLLFCLSKNKSLAETIQEIKGYSSLWMKNQGCQKFAWQGGYAAFSVSESVINATQKYILNQEEHHKRISFTEEIAHFCKLYKLEQYDETYFTNE